MLEGSSQDTGQFRFVLSEIRSRYVAEIPLEQEPKWLDVGLDPRTF